MINIEKIIGGMIQTNSYIIYEGTKAVLIDFVPEAENFLIDNNLQLQSLLLTHIHFDHIEGLSKFQEKNDFKIYLSKEAYDFLKSPNLNFLSIFPPIVIDNIKNIKLDNYKILDDNMIIKFHNTNIKALKSPGHSPDSMIYIIDTNKIVFSGDTIFQCGVGRTDLPGGNYQQMINSINKLFNLVDNDYILLPGHGPGTNVKYEKNNNPFLSDNFEF